jgi:methylenetetrahydrofolate dehydrogenase (NADP+)/methenyltetrahydrofolate cyclohydrolase
MTSPIGAALMDGASLSRKILEGCSLRAEEFTKRVGRRPRLAAVLVGSDPASVTYVKMKRARCERVSAFKYFPSD